MATFSISPSVDPGWSATGRVLYPRTRRKSWLFWQAGRGWLCRYPGREDTRLGWQPQVRRTWRWSWSPAECAGNFAIPKLRLRLSPNARIFSQTRPGCMAVLAVPWRRDLPTNPRGAFVALGGTSGEGPRTHHRNPRASSDSGVRELGTSETSRGGPNAMERVRRRRRCALPPSAGTPKSVKRTTGTRPDRDTRATTVTPGIFADTATGRRYPIDRPSPRCYCLCQKDSTR